MPTCHHAPIYHRGLLLPSFAHIPLGPCLRCSVQSSHIIMHPHTTGASWTLLCLIPPAIMQPYTTGAFCCHHSPIIHRGLVSGALSKAHISSCTPIPPGPVGHCFVSSHMPSCRHIPPGPSERQCSAQRTPAILHPYTTGAFERCSVQYTHGIIYPYTTGACERFFVQGTHAIMHPYTTGQCPHAIMQPVLSFRMHPRRKFKVQSSRFKV